MTGIIVLAAGESKRLGQPKQLLELGNKTLLDHAITAATGVINSRVVVIVGAKAKQILPHIPASDTVVIENTQWAEGIASSIRTGVGALTDISPTMKSIICMVCDQPYISTLLLERLILLAGTSEKGIIASEYKNTPGTPVLFKQEYFGKLLELRGDEGAKKLLSQYARDVETIPFAMGHIDVDTLADYEHIKQITNKI